MPEHTSSKMEKIVSLAKRRGFIFQSSEIYGGINGFWDYGPLGTALKKNLKDAWWNDIVNTPPYGLNQKLLDIVGIDASIIMNPKVWVASGHAEGFSDPMADCKETKLRYRADHLLCRSATMQRKEESVSQWFSVLEGDQAEDLWLKKASKTLNKQLKGGELSFSGPFIPYSELPAHLQPLVTGPDTDQVGTLTEPRQFNLMFKTSIGAVETPQSQAYLRPETAQGIFANFRNVLDTSRVKIPFGIAQIGKAFRNEVTPRHFTFRSREFEQMELEFFVPPEDAAAWYEYWKKSRYEWWLSIGINPENLRIREHDRDELAHYAKEGAGTADIEYRFPFTDPGFGELEGVAHRADFDLKQHAAHSGWQDRLKIHDIETKEKYFPHVIEPSAGADRGALALLADAYTEDPNRPSGVFLKFHPRMAPIKAAIFPLVEKDGMPEIAEKLYLDIRKRFRVQMDLKQNIGKRYARMDEAGTPFCFTVDTDTLSDQTVTVRYRDTLQQERLHLSKVEDFLKDKGC
ncbi:MAG: glyQS [Chlamydiales bacterium]|jgi:glycyl-tRNA synthetase|nr:glyQS [Chlamydiales bacterium]